MPKKLIKKAVKEGIKKSRGLTASEKEAAKKLGMSEKDLLEAKNFFTTNAPKKLSSGGLVGGGRQARQNRQK
tara:strand:+ start:1542 stop:1757 length:216 start_codon:yes stop_codon:yes gene_type:complete